MKLKKIKANILQIKKYKASVNVLEPFIQYMDNRHYKEAAKLDVELYKAKCEELKIITLTAIDKKKNKLKAIEASSNCYIYNNDTWDKINRLIKLKEVINNI